MTATVESVLHELAASVAYDDEAAIPWAVLVSVAEAHGVDLAEPSEYCDTCHGADGHETWCPNARCGLCDRQALSCPCDRDYERWAE